MTIRSNKFLFVVPNPFAGELDHEGYPASVVRYDPEHGRRGEVHFIGAEMKVVTEEREEEPRAKGKAPRGDTRQTKAKGRPVFQMWPHRVVHSDHHIRMVQEGGLLCADEKTARRVGVPWEEPVVVLERMRAKRIAEFNAGHIDEAPVEKWPDLSLQPSPEGIVPEMKRQLPPAPEGEPPDPGARLPIPPPVKKGEPPPPTATPAS